MLVYTVWSLLCTIWAPPYTHNQPHTRAAVTYLTPEKSEDKQLKNKNVKSMKTFFPWITNTYCLSFCYPLSFPRHPLTVIRFSHPSLCYFTAGLLFLYRL